MSAPARSFFVYAEQIGKGGKKVGGRGKGGKEKRGDPTFLTLLAMTRREKALGRELRERKGSKGINERRGVPLYFKIYNFLTKSRGRGGLEESKKKGEALFLPLYFPLPRKGGKEGVWRRSFFSITSIYLLRGGRREEKEEEEEREKGGSSSSRRAFFSSLEKRGKKKKGKGERKGGSAFLFNYLFLLLRWGKGER